MILRTWLVTRIGILIPGGVVLTAAGSILFGQEPLRAGHIIAVAVIAAPTIYFVVRVIRAAVVLHDDRITIRGWWWSRTIPRDRVVRISDRGWLVWQTRSGREARSPLALFWNYGDSRFVPLASHNWYALSRIRAWIERRDDVESTKTAP
jgi:hypothetical protein